MPSFLTPHRRNLRISLGRLDEMARDSISASSRNDIYYRLEMQLTGTLAILQTRTRMRQDMAAVPPATAHPNGSSEDLSTPFKSTAELAARVERSLFASTDQVLLDFYEAQPADCQVSIRAWREGNSLLSQEQSEELEVEEKRYQKLVDHERSQGAPAMEHQEGQDDADSDTELGAEDEAQEVAPTRRRSSHHRRRRNQTPEFARKMMSPRVHPYRRNAL